VLAEERHFGRAAERLHMGQSSLSRLIQSLESDLGVQLVRRTTRRTSLTPAGEILAKGAPALLGELAKLVGQVRLAGKG
jgi:DNA-binding transcriptional LysR family regulator